MLAQPKRVRFEVILKKFMVLLIYNVPFGRARFVTHETRVPSPEVRCKDGEPFGENASATHESREVLITLFITQEGFVTFSFCRFFPIVVFFKQSFFQFLFPDASDDSGAALTLTSKSKSKSNREGLSSGQRKQDGHLSVDKATRRSHRSR